MKKRPTEFSQITLLSNQKAKLIYQKNSKENNERVKLCKSFEIAKNGIKTTHGKKKKDLEKRLERHHQDSLNVDDIKSLRKYVGDARDENEFYSQFIECGRTRSSSVVSNKDGHAMTREMSKLKARNNFIRDLGKDMEFVPKDHSKLQRDFQRHDKTDHSRDVSRLREERETNSISFAKSGKVGKRNHPRSRAEGPTDAECCKTWSPKVQHENIAKNHKAGEMLPGLTVSSALPDTVTSHPKDELAETVKGAGEGEKCDENNNCFEGETCSQEDNGTNVFDSENQDNKVRQIQAATTDQSSFKVNPESKESSNASAFNQQRKDPQKGPVILKRLGPTPDECEEEVDEQTLRDEKDTTERRYPRQRKSSLTIVTSDRNLMEKSRDMFPGGNNPPVQRRRSSWAGPRSVTERLFKREFPEGLPQIDRNFETENDVRTSDLDNCDKPSQKSLDPVPNDALDGVSATGERGRGFERLEALKREVFHHKSNSVPLGLGSKVKIYSEEPFYMRPRRLSRRPSWQSLHLSEETLQGLQEIADKAKRDNEKVNEQEPETPLVSILPPITLQSIYAQQCSREKREQEHQESRKQRGTQKKIGEERPTDLNLLTDRLKDCRYLRHRKDPVM